jgi:acyl carrier protein phosphodiesterase
MNYLAHLFLSGNDEKILVGNFIGDYVKGKGYKKYPEPIQKGILLHRQIDSFTDKHTIFREAKKLIRSEYGLYSGIVTDIFYDHLLARNWRLIAGGNLRDFAKKAHTVLLSHFFYLPVRVQGFLPFLIQNRRLESYATAEGIRDSLEIMSRYSSLPEKSAKAVEIMVANSRFLEQNFFRFMFEIIDFVEVQHNIKIYAPGFDSGIHLGI